jgi:hypothetical protein
MRTTTTARLPALLASIAVTFTILSLVVDLGRPEPSVTPAVAGLVGHGAKAARNPCLAIAEPAVSHWPAACAQGRRPAFQEHRA